MLNNNNTSSVNKLSKKILKANKLRNLFAVMAIALTTLLITTTLTAGITFYKTNKLYSIVSTYGINADGYININNENIKKLEKMNNIKDIGITKMASIQGIKNKELLNERVSLEYANKKAYDMMFIVPIEGTFPKSEDEVLVPTWMLDVLKIDKKVGEKINLDIEIDGKVQTKSLKLCGYYESLLGRGSDSSKVFVSEDFINKYNKNILKEAGSQTAFLNLKNIDSKSTEKDVDNELDKIKKEIGATKAKVHPKYSDENAPVDNATNQIIAVVTGILIVIFTGYLIIYNIFYISVSKDIKFYGLLKTIGTTSKQLKKLILRQALILSIIGIPIGLILGYLVASYIIPLAMSMTIFKNITIVSMDMYIFLIATIFSLITVYISCRKPGKVAGKVSPVEATRYVSSDLKTSKKNSKKGVGGAKIHKMAWGNILKNKKKVFLSILSITLSALTIIFTVTATLGIDPEKHADNQLLYDMVVSNDISHFYGEEEYQPITENLIQEIETLDFVKEVKPQYSVIGYEADGKIYSFGATIKLQGKFKEEIESYKNEKGYNGFSYVDKDMINTEVKSLNVGDLDKNIDRVKLIDGKIDKGKFESGNEIIYYAPLEKANVLKAGDKITLNFVQRDKNGKVINEIKKDFNIMAIVTGNDNGWSANDLGFITMEENTFKETFKDYKNYVSKINIELKDTDDLGEADRKISAILIDSGNNTLGMVSKNYFIDGISELKVIFMTIGSIVGAILGFIGAINVINTVFSSIFDRKVEFAMLESIGMTKNQIKKMILFEGIYNILLTIILIIPLGIVVSFIAPMVVPIYGGFSFKIYALSVSICIIMISILMISVPFIAYKIISKESIVERIRS
ncbi:ABC transporter permease [Paraclostridium bifermentans]|uniref:ABC transporter permease n=1 Tax=Paraclostridium bifermentans TaxID=1490 RepID=UPI00359C42BC